MGAARTPVAIAKLIRGFGLPPGRLLGFARLPQAPAREPLQGDDGVLARQLIERRQELVSFEGPKRGRLVVDEDGPVGKTWRHPSIVSGIDGAGHEIRDDADRLISSRADVVAAVASRDG